jgi:hypothetical protein
LWTLHAGLRLSNAAGHRNYARAELSVLVGVKLTNLRPETQTRTYTKQPRQKIPSPHRDGWPRCAGSCRWSKEGSTKARQPAFARCDRSRLLPKGTRHARSRDHSGAPMHCQLVPRDPAPELEDASRLRVQDPFEEPLQHQPNAPGCVPEVKQPKWTLKESSEQ